MKISSVFITMLVMFFMLPVVAQPQPGSGPMKFSLNEAKNYALTNSPVLSNSARDVEIAKKQAWEYTTIGLPQVNLTSSYSYTPALAGLTGNLEAFIPGLKPEDLKTSFSMDVRVNQLIFSGQYIVGLKAAKVYANLSELANSKSEIGVVESLTNTYFTALIARESRDILDSSLTSTLKTQYETEQMYKNGFVEETDVDQLKILASNIKSSLSVANRQIDLMDRLLKFQMGLPIEQHIELTDLLDPLIDIINLEAMALDSFNLNNNVDYQLLTTQEKLRQLNWKVQKSQFLPTLSGFYQRYEDYDKNLFNDQSPDMFGISLNFPLFTSGQRTSQVKQKQLEYMQAQTNTQMASENLLIQYETAISEFLSAKDICQLQKENRNLSLRIYKKSITKFTEGIGTSLVLNQTQSQYFEAEGRYYNALMTLVSAKTKLESLLTKSVNNM
jgi:outer membrane protein